MIINFFVFPCEIQEINKRGGQNKLRGGLQNHEKNIRPPVYFEPESKQWVGVCYRLLQLKYIL